MSCQGRAAQRRSLTATTRSHNGIRGRRGLIISKRNTEHRASGIGKRHAAINKVVPMSGPNGSGLAGKVVPTGWRNGGGMADHFPHPRTHAVRLPNSRIQAPAPTHPRSQAPELTISGSRTHAVRLPNPRMQAPNHQTHDSRLASHSLTDQWLVQRRRIYRLALPKSGLYVHTMP